MNVQFITLGCKVNKYETDLLKEKCVKAGHVVVDKNEKADMYVINSCSVTNMSDRKTRQMVSKAKALNKNAIVAVLGCSVESNKDEKEAFLNADIVLGNEDKMYLFDILESKNISGNNRVTLLKDISAVKRYKKVGVLDKGTDIREQIKIEDGCNNFCSYCVIPYTSLEEIKKEAENLSKNNVKEIVVVGIEIASYGKDLENTDLFDVLDIFENTNEIERIRLTSLEPRFLSEENIKKLSEYNKLCPHFHISMQSGNDYVLKRMNRHYTKEYLIQVCENLRKYFQDPYIASDVIIGFPGETDNEFMDTVNTIKKMGICEIHVFKYSKRNYTKAAKMEGQVKGEIKKIRSGKLLELSKKLNENYLNKYIGKTVKVLFENYSEGYLLGYTPNYIKVKVRGEESLCGMIQDVDLISLEKEIMIGNLK